MFDGLVWFLSRYRTCKLHALMRIAKPILIVSTPIGVAFGLIEAHRLAGGLVFLMAMMVAFMGAAFGLLIYTIRREKRAASEAAAASPQPKQPDP
jgi:hypothetical protein